MSALSMGEQADNLRKMRVGFECLDALDAQEDKHPHAKDIIREKTLSWYAVCFGTLRP